MEAACQSTTPAGGTVGKTNEKSGSFHAACEAHPAAAKVSKAAIMALALRSSRAAEALHRLCHCRTPATQ
jgi:hypothetical protein